MNCTLRARDISAAPMRYIACLWQTIRYASHDIFRFAERVVYYYIIYYIINSPIIQQKLQKIFAKGIDNHVTV